MPRAAATLTHSLLVAALGAVPAACIDDSASFYGDEADEKRPHWGCWRWSRWPGDGGRLRGVSDRNREIIDILAELVELTILDEGSAQSFRVRAYENAMHELELVREDISQMSVKQLVAVDSVGKSTAKKIREYVDDGSIAKLEALRAAYPPAYRELSKIPGLGPKGLKKLRAELGVEDLQGLRAAIENHEISALKGFGKKSEEKIASAIERMARHGKHRRTPIAEVMPIAEALIERMEAVAGVERAVCCGSLRRFRETVADIDIVAASRDPKPVMTALVEWDQVAEILGHGETKSSIVTPSGLQVDLRVVAPEQMGAAILYFTGSKTHNIALRQRAIDRGWTLNEYGLTDPQTGETLARESEEEIYRALDMAWVPPPMREDSGEVARAAERDLPRVMAASDLPDGGSRLQDAAKMHAVELDYDSEAESATLTARLVDAASQPQATVLRHLTGRVIGERAAMEFDVDAVLRACVEHRVALEIDASLRHLDPPAEILRRAGELGAVFAIRGPTEHAARLAQRGWVLAEQVIDTWPDDRRSQWLADR